MGHYQDRVLPFLIHLSMCQRNLAAYRGRVVSMAEVLEIGIVRALTGFGEQPWSNAPEPNTIAGV